jgi:hypothetical protein
MKVFVRRGLTSEDLDRTTVLARSSSHDMLNRAPVLPAQVKTSAVRGVTAGAFGTHGPPRGYGGWGRCPAFVILSRPLSCVCIK